MDMDIKNNQNLRTGSVNKNPISNLKNKNKKARIGNEFQSILDKEMEDVKISAHAKNRIEKRNLDLRDIDIPKIRKGIDMLESKGARESLVLYKDMALIVNVRNKTVITAMDFDKDLDVITNIDSAIRIE